MHCESEKNPIQSEYVAKSPVYTLPPVTKSTLRTKWNPEARGYIHYFTNYNCEIPCNNVLYSYKVSMCSSKCTKVLMYSLTSPTTMHLAYNVYNERVTTVLHKHAQDSIINFKRLVIVTSEDCVVQLTLTQVPHVNSYALLEYTLKNSMDGHLIVTLPRSKCVRYHIPRPCVPIRMSLGAKKTTYKGIKYCITMNSLLTITEDLESSLKYPPYSVKLPQVHGSPLVLHYRIRVKASGGDSASVVVTCIESLSRSMYSILKDSKGNNISAQHTGCFLEGSLVLNGSPVDVGLHIHTPYGFVGDLGDNPDTDLVSILEFSVTYDS